MKKVFSRLFSVAIAIAVASSMLAGCSSKTDTAADTTAAAGTTIAETQEQSNGEYSLPLVKEPVTLTYWCGIDANYVAAGVKDLSQNVAFQQAMKRTGITIKFIHPPIGQDTESFNLLIASNDLPDIIVRNWTEFPGGPEKAIEDKLIIKLNDYISKYAPNYSKFLEANPDFEKMVKTDNGTHYIFPGAFTETAEGQPHVGPTQRKLAYESFLGLIMREDWLKDLGLSKPTTIDEWYTVLKAFKEKKNATSPLVFYKDHLKQSGAFIGAFGIAYGVTQDFFEGAGKKIKYGPMMDEYRQFLTTFNKWYKEGLIDPDFATIDTKTMDAKNTSGKSGAWIGYPGGGIGNYTKLMADKDPNYSLCGVSNPSLKKGEKAAYGQCDYPLKKGASAAITAQSKHPVEAAKFLDFGYSDEGDMLYNWGIEGTNYEMVNGQPQMMENVTKNPDGLSTVQAMMKYVHYNAPIAMDYANRKQMWKAYNTPKIAEGVKAWQQFEKPVDLPPVSIANDQIETYTKIMSQVRTYADEMMLKFIMGTESLDNFDKYVERLKAMGIEEAMKIQQEALDRYYKR